MIHRRLDLFIHKKISYRKQKISINYIQATSALTKDGGGGGGGERRSKIVLFIKISKITVLNVLND